MDKRKSCENCGSADHHVVDCTTYKQGMKSLGYTPDEEVLSEVEEHEFYSGLIIKIGARCFFFLLSRTTVQDGPSPILGSSEESESPKTQISTCCGAKHQK